MTLRSYSADSVARYSWAGGKLEAAPVKLHALGVFIPQSVTLKKNELLTIGGTRSTLILDSKTGQPKQAGQSFMNIEVDLHGADPAIVLPKMQEMLFFPDLAQAIAALPESVADALPIHPGGAPAEKGDYVHFFDAGHWIKIEGHASQFSNPVLVDGAEAEYTSEARQWFISGSITLLIYVDETGKVSEIWLTQPLGYGLDQNAAKSVQQYVFKPAQYAGHPVGTLLKVMVRFQTYRQ
jgi:TonB family protein